MNRNDLAREILLAVGGKENVIRLTRCAARLRLTLKDDGQVKLDQLKRMDDVHAALFRSGELQIILGTDAASKVYNEMAEMVNEAEHAAESEEDHRKKWNQLNSFFGKAQKFGKAIMLPIAVLPAAGILLGIGGALSNPNTLVAYPFLDQPWLQAIFLIMRSAGQVIFSNLPIIFAIGIAIGLARSDKGTAGLAAVLGYFVMNATLNAMLTITGKLAKDNLPSVGQSMILGIQTLETGVFGGVIVGLLTYFLHKRFGKVKLPQVLAFFGGSRFIPIVTSVASILLGVIMFVVWPFIQSGIARAGALVEQTGYLGTFLFGFIVKSLVPLGLHHIFYFPFWQTALGGTLEVNGKLVEGAQKIFFAQLADPNVKHFYIGTARFMSGKFLTMMFGLPGAALAMYHTARPENKKKVAGLLLSGALTSFLTGITEPLEFSFLFVAPLLFVIHAVFWGLAYMVAHIFQITIGQTFSAGLIDFTLFGILQGNDKTNWMLVPIFGMGFFVLYYVTFRFLIVKFDFKTPGREDQVEAGNDSGTINVNESAHAIITALGGIKNIKDVDCCATRLRVTVDDPGKVSDSALKQTGAKGVIIRGDGVQVIYGPHVTMIKNEIEEAMESQNISLG